jgi:hypothetical protein
VLPDQRVAVLDRFCTQQIIRGSRQQCHAAKHLPHRIRVHLQFLSPRSEEKTSAAAAEDHEEVTGRMPLVGDHGVGEEPPLARCGQDGIDFRQIKTGQKRWVQLSYERGQLRRSQGVDPRSIDAESGRDCIPDRVTGAQQNHRALPWFAMGGRSLLIDPHS